MLRFSTKKNVDSRQFPVTFPDISLNLKRNIVLYSILELSQRRIHLDSLNVFLLFCDNLISILSSQ